MRLTIIALAGVMSTGCTALQKNGALAMSAAVTVEANRVATNWETFVMQRIEECRNEAVADGSSTPETRRKCLGLAADGEKLEAGFGVLVAAQTAIWLAARCDIKSSMMPAPEKACGDISWVELAGNLQAAWKSIAPFAWQMAEELR